MKMSDSLKNWARLNVANMITLLRYLLCIIVFVGWIFDNFNLNAAIFLILLAMVSDALDGWIARKLQITSTIGGYLDKLGDKILVFTLTIILIFEGLDKIAGFATIATISLLSLLLMLEGALFIGGTIVFFKGIDFPSSKWGKRKMVVECMLMYGWLFVLFLDNYFRSSYVIYYIYFADLVLLYAIYLAMRSIENYYQKFIDLYDDGKK